MAGLSAAGLLDRSVRLVVRPLGELVHVAAIYLGIAALVTLMLGLSVPSVRSQMQQVYAALLVALQPESLQEDASGAAAAAQYDFLAQEADDDAGQAAQGAGTTASGTAAGGEDGAKALQSRLASSAYFVRELKASAKGLDIPGITSAQAQALRSYIARKYKIATTVAGVIIKTAFQVGHKKGLDPQLLLAVIAIESRYNPYAESHVGAQGLMQVMTKVHIKKFDPYGEGAASALNPIAHIRVGAQILHDCIKRRGSIKAGLSCYVGATGPSDGGYGARVLAEQRRIALASGIPIAKN
jgi:soluble lytic murein transglycosylase-like protein